MSFKKYFPIIIFVSTFIILLYTSHPSIGWWDSGNYAAKAYNLGIPGPGGSILYILLGRLFTIIFFFLPAIKAITLVSIVSTSFAAVCFYYTLSIILSKFQTHRNEWLNIVSFITALSVPFLYSIWVEAHVSRVYTLGLLLTGIILLCAAVIWFEDDERKKVKLFLLIIFILGIDFSAHRLNTPFIPVMLILLIFPLRKYIFNYKFWGVMILVYFTSFTIHLYLLVRAQHYLPTDVVNTGTLGGLLSWLNMEMYIKESNFLNIFNRRAPLWDYQIKFMYLRYFGWNFLGKGDPNALYHISFLLGMPLVFGIFGFFYNIIKNFKSWILIFIIFTLYSIVLIFYSNVVEGFHRIREIDRLFIPSFYIFTIWVGIGIYFFYNIILWILKNTNNTKRIAFYILTVISFILLPLNIVVSNWDKCNRNKYYFPVDFAYNILSSCEKDAVLFTNGDNDTYPLWYLQNVEGFRRDICVANLSLLNARFYLERLIKEPHSFPVGSSIGNIDKLSPSPLDKSILIKIPPPVFDNSVNDSLIFMFEGRRIGDKNVMLIQDKVLLSFLKENKWKRPVYFSSTVSMQNRIGLQNYLSCVGIVNKLLPVEGKNISPESLEKNLMQVYRFRYFNSPDIQLDEGTILLYNNFRHAFIRHIEHYINLGDKEKAKELFNIMNEKLPDWRYSDSQNKFIRHFENILENNND